MNKYENFGDIICEYKSKYGKQRDPLILYCMEQSPTELHEVIKIAACSVYKDKDKDKIHDHQRHVGKKILKKFADLLKQEEQEIKTVKNFEKLLSIVKSVKCHRVGELAKYDIAERIGFFLGIFPDKIYLHAGAKEGAKNLLGKLQYRKRSLSLEELPKELQDYMLKMELKFYDLEGLFCIYKKDLKQFSFESGLFR